MSPDSAPVFRLGYGPDPFASVPWRFLRLRDGALQDRHNDRTIGGRFDDPAGRLGVAEARRFRTIYCATDRIAAISESIEPFRSQAGPKRRSSELTEIIERHPQLRDAAGTVPKDWVDKRLIESTILDESLQFVELGHSTALDYLNVTLGSYTRDLGFHRIDYGTILGADRRLTQAIAGHFYEILDADTDQPLFAGLSYISSLDLGWRCWAIFDQRFRPEPQSVSRLQSDDPELVEAASRYELVVDLDGQELP